MKRRALLKWVAGAPLFGALLASAPEGLWAKAASTARTLRRVRPGESGWPSTTEWDGLNEQLGTTLVMATDDPLTASWGSRVVHINGGRIDSARLAQVAA